MALILVLGLIMRPVLLVWRALIRILCRANDVLYPESREIKRQKANLKDATRYDTWLTAALRLDDLYGYTKWKEDPDSPLYARREIERRLSRMTEEVLGYESTTALAQDLNWAARGARSHAKPELYGHTYVGTKRLIEDYIETAFGRIETYSLAGHREEDAATYQHMMVQFENARRGAGRTTLILQGGGVFALHHLGVMRGLLERELMPRTVFGTSTGAWMAAMAGMLTDENLLRHFNSLDSMLTTAVDELRRGGQALEPRLDWNLLFYSNDLNFRTEPYDENRDVIRKMFEAIMTKETTFREAHQRTGRLVTIEIASDSPSIPNSLNYITTPDVVIYSAALAAQSDDYDVAPSLIQEKSYDGKIQPWSLNDESPAFREMWRKQQRPRGTAHLHLEDHKKDALRRMAQIFNSNHFIISQPRPYMWPLPRNVYWSRSQQPDFLPGVQSFTRRFLNAQWELRMRQWARNFGVPHRQQQLMLEDRAPGMTITLAPDAQWKELGEVVRNPSKEALYSVIARGEKSVWPCVSALNVRMDVELALERHHQRMKSKKT